MPNPVEPETELAPSKYAQLPKEAQRQIERLRSVGADFERRLNEAALKEDDGAEYGRVLGEAVTTIFRELPGTVLSLVQEGLTAVVEVDDNLAALAEETLLLEDEEDEGGEGADDDDEEEDSGSALEPEDSHKVMKVLVQYKTFLIHWLEKIPMDEGTKNTMKQQLAEVEDTIKLVDEITIVDDEDDDETPAN